MTGSELVGGPEKRAIIVADYDPAWVNVFEEHRARLMDGLGARAIRIEHVGSTAVPGLAAKPIVDIQLSVANVEDEQAYVPPLEEAGYCLRVREPGHRMLRVFDVVHLHVCTTGTEWERRHILFRDWLRNDAEDRELYDKTKRELARKNWETMNHYADAKSAQIALISIRAERWARAVHWNFDS